jgi:hypothetical protein
MTDYRLDGLNARTFEHLIQSLAVREIVSTATPFGDGPDGGREATFNGPTNYGPAHARWTGYGVIQAKFLQRPSSNRRTDGRWVESELKKELKKYTRQRKPIRVPDYYILATNATLSSVEGTGSKDRVLKVLRTFADENSVADFDLWDYDKIRLLLDSNEEIRNAYAAWITPGDVLMQLSRNLEHRRPDYHKVICKFLQKELLSDQFAKLEQAGHTADEAIPLAQVFVDLPIATRAYSDAAFDHVGAEKLQGFVDFVISRSAQPLLHSNDEDEEEGADSQKRGPVPGRIVLIGGPGQGKTTLGQYVCQVFRAALLADVSARMIGVDARNSLRMFQQGFQSGEIQRPAARRLPFRIVLSDFAAHLADCGGATLASYLLDHFNRRASSELALADFQELLVRYPSLLVLDGLDEVPASSNREQVLSAVQEFTVDIAADEVDMLIIATSRPQGYNEDFSPKIYNHRWLVPLPREKALTYGTKLAQVRFAGDADRIEKIVSRLDRATKGSATARIMRSPLQVTILTLLVDRRGQLPQERWALFDEYYALIYQRETERDIPAAAILRDRKDDIDAVHRLVGLLLQIESEKTGKTDARLTTDQFRSIVEHYLRSEGNEGAALAELRDAIIEGAATRLVFLVGLEAGEVGFEIRSLQEFMAAEGLLDADDGLVQSRLRAVASNSNWRNVVLFAAGKIFAERRYLRDTVESICVELNDDPSDRAAQLTLTGSELALDLLEDGPVARQPAKSRSLTRLALRLLEVDDPRWQKRLASLLQESTADIYLEIIESHLLSRNVLHVRNAWALLTAIGSVGDPQRSIELAKDALARGTLPGSVTLAEMLFPGPLPIPQSIAALLEPILARSDLSAIRQAYYGSPLLLPDDALDKEPTSDWIDVAARSVANYRVEQRIIRVFQENSQRGIAEIILSPLSLRDRSPNSAMTGLPEMHHQSWELLRRSYDFAAAPSARALADVLRAAEACEDKADLVAAVPALWPLEECLFAGQKRGEFSVLIEALDSGLLGDTADWMAWESAWLTRGVTPSLIGRGVDSVIESGAAEPWYPLYTSGCRVRQLHVDNYSYIEAMLSHQHVQIDSLLLMGLGNRIIGSHRAAGAQPPPERVLQGIQQLSRTGSWRISAQIFSHLGLVPPKDHSWARAFSEGALAGEIPRIGGLHTVPLYRWFIEAYEAHPDQVGLLICLMSQLDRAKIPDGLLRRIWALPESLPLPVHYARMCILLAGGVRLSELQDSLLRLQSEASSLTPLIDAVASDARPLDLQIEELLILLPMRPDDDEFTAEVVAALRSCIRSRQSELAKRGRWTQLGFMEGLLDVMSGATASTHPRDPGRRLA